ncbi:hypothetical protein [Streptomyces sp. NPDC053726]
MFIAEPPKVQAGGGQTDEVSRLIKKAADAFTSATAFDPQNPPWGDDQIGGGFAANYLEPHAKLRDAIASFAGAVAGAAQRTMDSGTDFQRTQDGALEQIHQNGGGRR